eukprot:m.331120 g.331120  ORF g.331120 m.331120 type:complete len:113 (+) comp16648_c0_seq1:91-429(+)
MASSSELACVYAALILADDEQEITGEKIGEIVKASGVEVEGYLPGLFGNACKGMDVATLVASVGSGGGGGGGGGAAGGDAPAAGGDAPAAEEKKEEAKEESEEEDMGFGLFD